MSGINVGGSSVSNLTKARPDSLKLRTGHTKQAEECMKSDLGAYNLRTRMYFCLCADIHRPSTGMVLWGPSADP